ncbi:MAG TPA: prolyl oligopeptidase family serine peptidase [Elusimicrobiota bacterium]|nr:prolyl oligopeptidase family serine peptidase [Elusimicrobiota bacterium]
MKLKTLSLAALALLLGSAAVADDAPDPRRWLEDIDSPRSLDWVKARDEKTLKELQADPRWKQVEADARAVVTATDRIPAPELRGRWIYNLWQDPKSVRGLWRRTSPEEYRKPKPRWETVLDLDALAKKEKENWVWKGADCLQPEQTRCLLTLSRGGGDASVVREFDSQNKRFVHDGFELAEAKSDVAWLDADDILVGTNFGPGTLTKSGYPRVLKLWKRGAPLSAARTLYEGREEDVSVSPWVARRPDGKIALIDEALTFYTERLFVLGEGGTLSELAVPRSAELRGYFDGRLLFSLRDPWSAADATIPAGALIAWLPGAKIPETVWTPDATQSLQSVATTEDALYLSILENVQGAVLRARREGGSWSVERLKFPAAASLGFAAADDFSKLLLVNEESFLEPTAIADAGGEVWRRLPARFDATGLSSEQRWATSADGTKVPYFLVRRTSEPFDGTTPTILYGYGGFEISMDPYYLATVGRIWLSRGGAYALANIRGGGEFGPKWHAAALKEHRQRAFDDFEAVAEDLEKTKETSPAKLAIQGGSNGGLLVATALTERPDLYGAVVCEVPITDMLRYDKLLAGNSWVGEYGTADDPAMRPVLLKYSPYQNVRPGVHYPKTLIYTSTKDDRVHPGHARKFAAALEDAGAPVTYYENTEGGHSAAANLEQRVKRYAIEYTFLLRALF